MATTAPSLERIAPSPPAPSPAERAPGIGGLRLGLIAGIELVADWSLFIVFALVAYQLGAFVLPGWHPTWGIGRIWGVSIVAAVCFFGSILVHELSHSLVARAFGTRVRRITLFLFGGTAQIEGEPRSPGAELLIAAAGPLTSLAIGIGATAAGVALAGDPVRQLLPYAPALAYAEMAPLPTILLWLGPVNVVLALFNLVPGFPLDGGRVLRALFWWATGNLRTATRWAAGGGILVGWCLVALGVVAVLGGFLANGIWFALIGVFLATAARSSYEALVVRESLAGLEIERVMRRDVTVVSPAITVEQLVDEYLMATDQQAFPVLDAAGQLVGLVGVEEVRRAPRSAWHETPVSSIMTRADRLTTITPQTSASDALTALASRDVDQLLVVESGHLAGIVRRQDLMKWLAMLQA